MAVYRCKAHMVAVRDGTKEKLALWMVHFLWGADVCRNGKRCLVWYPAEADS